VMIFAATIFTLGGRKPVPLRLMLGRRPRTRTRRFTAADATRFRPRSDALQGPVAR
jgi:hypothetical protein